MNENSICKRHSIMVNIAMIQMYCEHFIMTAHTQLYEKANLMGNGVITGQCPKATKLTYIGRVYNENDPFNVARTLASFHGIKSFDTHYRGMIFRNCVLEDFKVEDKGDDFVYLTITAATSSPVEYNSKDNAS